MDFELRIMSCELPKSIDLFSSDHHIDSDLLQCSKDPTFDNNFELCQNIKKIKKVKAGKKRELKFVLQNTEKLQYTTNPYRNKLKKKSISSQQTISINSLPQKTQIKNKKIVKRLRRIIRRRKITSESNFESEKNSYYPLSTYSETNHTSLAEGNILGYKGMNIFNNILQGDIGHSTLVFSHKITEGSYYLQIKVNESCTSGAHVQYQNKSQIRIGLCQASHPRDIPLGFKNSIGFHLNKKLIITQGQKENLCYKNQEVWNRQIKTGDIIGMLLQFSPPYKYADRSKNWQDSCIKFYLNGQLLGKYQKIKQMFYHPAISLYNGASVQVRTQQLEMDYLPQGSLAYQKISQYINTYK